VWEHPVASACLLAIVAAASVFLNTDFRADPRFDGAGYAVLGESLATGQGYREIDHPDEPRHAHFPPGYPMALALLWTVTGRSIVAAHLLSCVCTVGATVAAWWWFRALFGPRVALLLGLALAMNWTWGRNGGEIQSEPLFLLLQQPALLAALAVARGGRLRSGLALGFLLGICTLTRHVGICLALAVIIDLFCQRRRSAAIAVGLGTAAVLLPWILWLLAVRHNTQAALLAQTGLVSRVAEQALFYVRRIPDQITGPIVEVGTVFRRSGYLSAGLTLWAAFATGLVLLGWLRSFRSPRRRIVGLAALATLALLVIWPFTEAGRFLVPLVPFILIGAMDGLAIILAALRHQMKPIRLQPVFFRENRFLSATHLVRTLTPRTRAAALLLALSTPYALYAIATGRSEAQRATHRDFDAACAWLREHGTRPGPVLTRHPGEVYCRTRRRALAPSRSDPAAIAQTIEHYGVAYLLIDEDRYARAPSNPLTPYVEHRPDTNRMMWRRNGISIYEATPSPREGEAPSEPSMRQKASRRAF
jgi:4-amino-4-deoxy-L-arabinose transferase-like glycosyltransferase